MKTATLVAPERIAVAELPWIVSHEGVGDIVAVSTDVDAGRIGQRVAIEPNSCCRGAIHPGQVLDSARPRFHDFE